MDAPCSAPNGWCVETAILLSGFSRYFASARSAAGTGVSWPAARKPISRGARPRARRSRQQWQHDILRADGTPFSARETQFIKVIMGKLPASALPKRTALMPTAEKSARAVAVHARDTVTRRLVQAGSHRDRESRKEHCRGPLPSNRRRAISRHGSGRRRGEVIRNAPCE